MERDFLGLVSKPSLPVVKEEVINHGFKEAGLNKGSGNQWPFANKVSAVPQLMPFSLSQGDKNRKIGSDALLSSGFMPLSTSDAYNRSQKLSASKFQNTFGLSLGPRSTGGVPLPFSTTPECAVGKSAELWKSVKASGSPAQLTIFYGGAVNVYDDISPEKAQAIMLLAGNVASNMTRPKSQVEEPILKIDQGDSLPASQLTNLSLTSGLSSPLSSHSGTQSRSGSNSTEELVAAKTTGVATTPISPVNTAKAVNAKGSVAVTNMIPSVPQARKASLARFLEKRKERVMSATPYNLGKK